MTRHTVPRHKKQSIKLSQADELVYQVAWNDITTFTQYYFDWTPFPWQHQFYHAPQKDKLVVAGVRSGKTAIVSAGFIHYMLYNPNSRIANASISADQANIVFYQCLDFVSRPEFAHLVDYSVTHPYPIIRLLNGSEAWFRSVGYEAELWRGHEFDWINVDEAAYVANEMAIHTLKTRLLGRRRVYDLWKPRDGIFTMTSTPKGKTWLFGRWKLGDPDSPECRPEEYLSMRARTRDNTSLRPEDIERLMGSFTRRMRDQEELGLFVDSEGAQFEYQDVTAMYTPIIKDPQTGAFIEGRQECTDITIQVNTYLTEHVGTRSNRDDITFYELDPKPDHYYVNTWDIGQRPNKLGRNATVGGVIDITGFPWRLVAYAYLPGVSYTESQERIDTWQRRYNNGSCICETIVDATGKGDVISQELQERRLNVEGLQYSRQSKALMITSLKLSIERGWLVTPFIKRMADQLQGYEVPDDKIAQDIVMMLAQGALVGRRRNGDIDKTVAHPRATYGSSRHAMAHPSMTRLQQRREAGRTGRVGDRSGHNIGHRE